MNYNKFVKHAIKKWYVVALTVLLAIIVGLTIRAIFTKKVYRSQANCYVTTVYDADNGVNLTDGILDNFLNLSKTSVILSAIKEDASIKMLGYTEGQLNSALNIYRKSNVIVIECLSASAIDSQLITQAYLNTGMPKVKSILSTSTINEMDYSVVTTPQEGEAVNNSVIPTLLIAIVLGGVVGMAILLLPALKGKLGYEPNEIKEQFGINLLAILPDKKLSSHSKKPVDTSELAMEYEAGVGTALSAINASGAKSVTVCSCDDASQSAELVRKIGGIGLSQGKVLVIDADFREQTLTKLCAIEDEGLSEYLLGTQESSNIVKHSAGIDIIPVGNQPKEAITQLLSGGFAELISIMLLEYDLVVVSAPAYNKARDVLTIAKCSETLMLTFAATTNKKIISTTIDAIDQDQIPLLGVVMDKFINN